MSDSYKEYCLEHQHFALPKKSKKRTKWDDRYLGLAKHVSDWSKDPSTKTGAVIVRPNNSICSLGFNGFPRNILDSPERYNDRNLKYDLIIHAEINAKDNAAEKIKGYTLYTWPFITCCRCAVQMINEGIAKVVSPLPSEDALSRWGDSFETARELYREARIQVIEMEIL